MIEVNDHHVWEVVLGSACNELRSDAFSPVSMYGIRSRTSTQDDTYSQDYDIVGDKYVTTFGVLQFAVFVRLVAPILEVW